MAALFVFLGVAALAGLVYLVLASQDPVSRVNLAIDPNTGKGPDENELRFTVETSRSFVHRNELFTGQYAIRYGNATVHLGTFRVPEIGKASVALNLTEFYRDNGLYTVRVAVEGRTASDEVELVRTVHGLDPVLNDLFNSFRLGLGLRPTDEPGDDEVVTTLGHGTATFYYVEQGNDTADPGNWEQAERVTFEIGFSELFYVIASDGSGGANFIDLDREYLTHRGKDEERPPGHFAARVAFHNDFSTDPLAFDEPVIAMTSWIDVG